MEHRSRHCNWEGKYFRYVEAILLERRCKSLLILRSDIPRVEKGGIFSTLRQRMSSHSKSSVSFRLTTWQDRTPPATSDSYLLIYASDSKKRLQTDMLALRHYFAFNAYPLYELCRLSLVIANILNDLHISLKN